MIMMMLNYDHSSDTSNLIIRNINTHNSYNLSKKKQMLYVYIYFSKQYEVVY